MLDSAWPRRYGDAYPEGETQDQPFQLSFNPPERLVAHWCPASNPSLALPGGGRHQEEEDEKSLQAEAIRVYSGGYPGGKIEILANEEDPMEHDIKRLDEKIEKLNESISNLATLPPGFGVIIHKPGWTTIAEFALVEASLDSGQAQVEAATAHLRRVLDAAGRVGAK